MSAWLVSTAHVRALVTAAQDGRLAVLRMAPDPDAMGRALLEENARSLRARYGDADEEARRGCQEGAAYAHVGAHVAAPVVMVKACDCFDYQACESSDYQRTPAAALVQAVRADALSRMGLAPTEDALKRVRASKAYDDAPWGLEDEHVSEDPPAGEILTRGDISGDQAFALELRRRDASRDADPMPAGGLFDQVRRHTRDLFSPEA